MRLLNKENFLFASARLVVFDLDGTLTKSKTRLDAEMAKLFCALLQEKKVGVMGGGAFAQFQNQFLKYLRCSRESYKNLFLLPVSGGSMYAYKNKKWQIVYRHLFSSEEVKKIKNAFRKTFPIIGYQSPKKIYGKILENRGSQITFSALGQKTPLPEKILWNKKYDIRPRMQKILQKYLPAYEIRRGGLTSIDITKKGINKAYGLQKLLHYASIKPSQAVYIGDALYQGGNDSAVLRTKIKTIPVKNEKATKSLIIHYLKNLNGESHIIKNNNV